MEERALRILIVDRIAERAEGVRRLLVPAGRSSPLRAEIAPERAAAFRKLSRDEWDAVLIDSHEVFGQEILEHLRDRNPGTCVIVLGDAGDERAGIELVKKGARDYLDRRHLTTRSLAAAIEEACALSREELRRHRANEAFSRAERDYRNIFESLSDCVLVIDPRTEEILAANSRACRTYGASREELVGLPLRNFLPVPDQTRRVLDDMMATGESREFETVHFARDGRRIDMLVTASIVEYGGRTAVLSLNKDITATKRAEDEIARLAYHDPLTGLANRVRLEDRILTAIAQARRDGHLVALLYLDLDRFKLVNDSLGHRGGDALLQLVAQRLSDVTRVGDTLARLGGDEFVLVLSRIGHADEAAVAAQRVLDSFAAPFAVGGREIFITTSIGVCVHPQDGESFETLLKNGDIAMYRAKQSGRNAYECYVASKEETAVDRLSLETDLHWALSTGQLRVFYQPKLDLRTGDMTGAEALVRWLHPERGLLAPGRFIPIAEETGLILRLGELVLREACRQARRWREAGRPAFRVSVNLSAAQFQQSDLALTIRRSLDDSGAPPEALDLEITETIAMKHVERTTPLLDELTRMGVSITMDDFGTGYSSLTYLRRFPVTTVKIDKSFIRDLASNASDASITRAMIVMSHELKMRVIAEGVETEQQRAFLAEHGCDEIQGYLVSPPVPADELESLLQEARPPKKRRTTA